MSGRCKAYCRISGAAVLAVFIFINASALLAVGQIAITTYHYDNNRTGWNQSETVLTPANVGSASFGLLQTVPLDDQVDAQPLVVPGVQITAGTLQGLHDVVYVATERQHGLCHRRAQRSGVIESEFRNAGLDSLGMQ